MANLCGINLIQAANSIYWTSTVCSVGWNVLAPKEPIVQKGSTDAYRVRDLSWEPSTKGDRVSGKGSGKIPFGLDLEVY